MCYIYSNMCYINLSKMMLSVFINSLKISSSVMLFLIFHFLYFFKYSKISNYYYNTYFNPKKKKFYFLERTVENTILLY